MTSGFYKIAHSFTYEATVLSAAWSVTHMLGYKPTVDVFIDLGAGIVKVVPSQIIHTDNNSLEIFFSVPHVGKAICN